jgi:WD40 repeat protein/serine/threonine protein kinase/Tfp pilus assembly protein PilF
MSSQPPVDEKEVFNSARRITDPEVRARFLESACGNDRQALQRVQALLSVHITKDTFLESPVIDVDATGVLPVAEQPGDQIGPYKLLEPIGEGGMGVVYLAEQSEPVERRVAVKIIKPGMDTGRVIARFEAERQALAIMDHPGIARVFDAGATETGRPYFAMELVKGISITQYCDEHRLDPRERLQLFREVCHAVQHAHQKGIIHRDLKPSNVLVAEYDDQPVPKIIDFGVAKATQHRLTNKTLFTEAGMVVGTVEYMSPEQAKLNQPDIDTRSDIYSLGVLLYELLTGETPFDRKKLRSAALDEMLRIIREEEPSRPSIKLDTSESLPAIAANRRIEPRRLSMLVRGELDWIVMKALEKDRSRRYGTANAFASDIWNYLNDEAVQACPPGSAYRFKKFARRNKVALTTIGLVSTALILGLVGTSWQTIRALDERDQKEIARREALSSAERARAAQGDERLARQAEAKQRSEAERLRELAESRALLARQNLYTAHMNLASQALASGHITRTQRLLERHVPGPGEPDWRHFEWYYLLGQCQQDLLTIPASTYFALAFSSDSQRLATADREHIEIWDVADGKRVKRWQAHPNRVHAVAYSPDGKRVASGSYRDSTANEPGGCNIWDAETGTLIHRLVGVEHTVGLLVYSPDGKWLAAVDGSGYGPDDVPTVVRLWDARTGLPAQQLGRSDRGIGGLAFSPDSQRLVAAGSDTLRMWNVESGQPLPVGQMHGSAVAWSPDGKLLATNKPGSEQYEDGPAVLLWDPATGQRVRELNCGTPAIDSQAMWVAFSPDAKQVAAGMRRDNSIRVWDVQSGNELAVLRGHAGWVWRVTFSPNSRFLASCCGFDSTVRLWDTRYDKSEVLPGGDKPWRKGHVKGRPHLAVSPDGMLMAATQGLQNVAVVELASRKTRATLDAGSLVRAVCFSPDGQQIAVGSESGLHVWNVATERLLYQRAAKTRALAFSPDGRQLFVSNGRSIQVLNTKDYSQVDVILEESWPTISREAEIEMLAVSSDGTYLAVQEGDFGGTLHVWDLHRRQIKASFSWTRWLTDVEFSPDSKTVAASGGNWFNPQSEGTTKLWDVETRRELATLRGHDGLHTSLAFTPDGSTLAIASDIGEITLWDLETFEERITLSRGQEAIDCLAFLPDGSALLSGSTNESVKVWQAASSERIAQFEQQASIRRAREYRQSRQWDKAIAAYTQILEADENLPVRVLRGAANTELGLWDQAEADFATAAGEPVETPRDWAKLVDYKADLLEQLARAEVDKQHVHHGALYIGPAQMWLLRGAMHRELNQDAKAEADYLNALDLGPNRGEVAKIMQFLASRDQQRRGGASGEPRIEAFESILDDYYTGKLEVRPTASELIDRGEWLRKRGQHEKAIELFTEAIRLEPKNARAFGRRAFAYCMSREYERAIADFDVAINLNPNNAYVYGDRALALIELGEYDRAIADSSKAIELAPQWYWAFQRRSRAHWLRGEFSDAARDARRAIEINPATPNAYHQLASTLIAARRWDEAGRCFEQLVELEPKKIGHLKQLAMCEYMLRGVDSSRQRCRTAIERFITPEASALVKREVVEMCCSVMNAVDDTEAMVELAREVIVANPPDEAWSRGVFGQALLCNGQSGEAIPLLLGHEAEAANKLRGYTMFLLAKAYHASGKPDVAIEWLNKADTWTSQYLAQGDYEFAVFPLIVQVGQKDAHDFLGMPMDSSHRTIAENPR